MNPDKVSYLMLFCSLLLVQKSAAKLDDLVPLLPSASSARQLTQQILGTQNAA